MFSARTVKLFGPRSLFSGCWLIVISAIPRSTGPTPSVSSPETTGEIQFMRVGCRFPNSVTTVESSAFPIGCTMPSSKFVIGWSTVPTGMPTTLILLVSITGAGAPSTPINPPIVPEMVTGAFTSGISAERLISVSTLMSTATS